MKKALLIDTNFSSYPISKFLEKNKIEVSVIGGNTADFLAKSSPSYINHNYADIEATEQLLNDINFDYIVPGCNDFSYHIASILNKGRYFGIDSPETTEKINNKEEFRALASRLKMSIPRVFKDSTIGSHFPVIVKPVDAYSGRGVKIISQDDKSDLDDAIKTAREFSRTGTCIVEEFVDGQLYSHSAFISNKKIHTDFIVIEHGTASAFAVDTSRVVYDFPSDILKRIREEIELMSMELELLDGLIHTQFILKDNKFWFIEITRRCPGDQYSQLIELSTGFPYAEAYARPFINLTNEVEHKLDQKFIIRHTMSYPEEVLLSSLRFNVPVQIERFLPLSLAGDIVKTSPFGRIGVIFFSTETRLEQDKLYDLILARKLYSMN